MEEFQKFASLALWSTVTVLSVQVDGFPSQPALPLSWTLNSRSDEGPQCITFLTSDEGPQCITFLTSDEGPQCIIFLTFDESTTTRHSPVEVVKFVSMLRFTESYVTLVNIPTSQNLEGVL